jgi:hypothetical protein
MSYPQQQWQQPRNEPRHDTARAPRGRPLTFWQTVWAVTLGVVFAGIILTVVTWVAAFFFLSRASETISDSFESSVSEDPASDECRERWLGSESLNYETWASTNC